MAASGPSGVKFTLLPSDDDGGGFQAAAGPADGEFRTGGIDDDSGAYARGEEAETNPGPCRGRWKLWLFLTLGVVLLGAVVMGVALSGSNFRACTDSALAQRAMRVLDGNWRTDKTLPNPSLYPHQWSWDSAFISMGLAWYSLDHAMEELTTLFDGQWTNGLLPHIVFNASVPADAYFPGPRFWNCSALNAGAPVAPPTSGIVDPPVHATAALAVLLRAEEAGRGDDAMAWLSTLYPKLVKWHDYLYRERDPDGDGLVYIRHPWESGADNSPNWDRSLHRIVLHPGDIPPYHRSDLNKPGVNPADRPSNWTYDRYVFLVECAKNNGYNESRIIADPKCRQFLVDDVMFNSILARAGMDLSDLAGRLGFAEDQRRFNKQAVLTVAGLRQRMWDGSDKMFYDFDEDTRQPVVEPVGINFAPVFGGVTSEGGDIVDDLLASMGSPAFCGGGACPYPMPSYSTQATNFSQRLYWRGPTWLNINWMLINGLERWLPTSGADIADSLRKAFKELVETQGFYEYFSPLDGTPHGTESFSWSAALYLDLLCSEDPSWN